MKTQYPPTLATFSWQPNEPKLHLPGRLSHKSLKFITTISSLCRVKHGTVALLVLLLLLLLLGRMCTCHGTKLIYLATN